jgi:predicted O-methyltransferase YrrM
MKFTQDWFSQNIPNFEFVKANLTDNKRILEIGSFEGRSTCWILENMLDDNGHIYCLDSFKGGEEHVDLDLTSLIDVFHNNVLEVKKSNQTITTIENMSYLGLSALVVEELKFDFIYVDGNHLAREVLTDACLAWKLLDSKGVILFDDYLGGMEVKQAVDAFIYAFKPKVLFQNYQLAIIKE